MATSTGSPSPSSPAITGAPLRRQLPRTSSADVYAAAVAEALWNVDYAATSRQAVLGFWRAQLATVLPAGVPAGTTLTQAQDAAVGTVAGYLPGAAMWATLAADSTSSSFHVTGVSEPPAWVAAVTAGKIADPGLTARTVIGVQTLTYGRGATRRSTRQTEQLTVAMLCPPTAASCAVEVFPPADTAGTTA